MSHTVLIVDDDASIRSLVKDFLGEHGYTVVEAANASEMDRMVASAKPDIILLDLGLPDKDGLAIAKTLRDTSDIPVIMVTGRKDDVDRIVGLELGADDYVTKPFNPRELMARVKAVLRRFDGSPRARRSDTPRVYQFGHWELFTGTRRLKREGQPAIELTNSEYALLVAFLRSPRQILSRDKLLEMSRMHDDIYDRSIDVQILRVRRKVEEDASSPHFIKTERGQGYYLDCEVGMQQ
jgi:two-component system, OmpR family, response regulator